MVDSTSPSPTHIERTTEPSPELETMKKEEIKLPEFPFNIEEDIFQNFGNTSMYPCEKRPPVPKEPIPPPDKASLKEAVKGVTAIMNSDWHMKGKCHPKQFGSKPPRTPFSVSSKELLSQFSIALRLEQTSCLHLLRLAIQATTLCSQP